MKLDTESLAHTKWNCKYHIVFAPKYRRQVIYGKIKSDIGQILRKLCEYKGVDIIEAGFPISSPGDFNSVVEIINLTAASEFLLHCLNENRHIVFDNIALNGKSVLRCFFKHGHIAVTRHCHVERSRNGRCGEGENINGGEILLEFFFLGNAEALFFFNNNQSEVAELNVF